LLRVHIVGEVVEPALVVLAELSDGTGALEVDASGAAGEETPDVVVSVAVPLVVDAVI
jgi:hypothetical protein